jgi:hypothetical protein
MKRKNRSLDTIADDIHKLARCNIFDIGDLLIEAKEKCEHGNWLHWLWTEFEYAASTAERYMNAARLSTKFPTVRNLMLAANTIYALADEYEADDLPAIIEELAKHATQKRLTHKDAERVIKVGIGRHRHGDHTDATLIQLTEIDEFNDQPWYQQAVDELRRHDPETDEIADSIVGKVQQDYFETIRNVEVEEVDEDEQEADAVLDGPPPDLPPPIAPPEPQKLDADSDWAETKPFVDAVKGLIWLRAKPIGRFVGMFSPAELREVADFLMDVAAADKNEAEHADKSLEAVG